VGVPVGGIDFVAVCDKDVVSEAVTSFEPVSVTLIVFVSVAEGRSDPESVRVSSFEKVPVSEIRADWVKLTDRDSVTV